jgi:hypothetical protein
MRLIDVPVVTDGASASVIIDMQTCNAVCFIDRS